VVIFREQSVVDRIFIAGSFAGLGFLSLYLSGKIKAFDGKGHVAKLCIVILPLLLASLVGISRVDNYRHHWEDVFVGGLIGMYFFPSLLPNAWRHGSVFCNPR
jgi:membrane-associated phospholipid phosphatase